MAFNKYIEREKGTKEGSQLKKEIKEDWKEAKKGRKSRKPKKEGSQGSQRRNEAKEGRKEVRDRSYRKKPRKEGLEEGRIEGLKNIKIELLRDRRNGWIGEGCKKRLLMKCECMRQVSMRTM